MSFLVRTTTADSLIAGQGCFALQHIKPGMIVWTYDPAVDCALSEAALLVYAKDFLTPELLGGCWYDPTRKLYHINPADRYINHSASSNLSYALDNGLLCEVATRHIEPGEEMTFNYKELFLGSQTVWDTLYGLLGLEENGIEGMCVRPNAEAALLPRV